MGDVPLIIVPYLDEDIHDLAGIEAMDAHLFAGEAGGSDGRGVAVRVVEAPVG